MSSKRIVFRHMPAHEMVEKHAQEKLGKIEAFLAQEQPPFVLDLVMEPSKTREHHKIELIVKTPQYDRVVNQEFKGDNFYEALDYVIDTMYLKLHEDKQRRVDERKMVGRHDEFKKQR